MISTTAAPSNKLFEELPVDVELPACSAAGVIFTAGAPLAPLSFVGVGDTSDPDWDAAVGVVALDVAGTGAVAVSIAGAAAVEVASAVTTIGVAVLVICGARVLAGCAAATVLVSCVIAGVSVGAGEGVLVGLSARGLVGGTVGTRRVGVGTV